MERIYLSRTNLEALLSKLDRKANGESTACTIIKRDLSHPKYPCSCAAEVIAIEDEEYYTDRPAGPVYPADIRRI